MSCRATQQSPGGSVLLGDCYLRMGREEDVIRILEPAEQKYPDDLAIAYLLGTALIREKRVDEGQVLVESRFCTMAIPRKRT